MKESPLGSVPESGASAADLVDLFQSEITQVLDDQAPVKTELKKEAKRPMCKVKRSELRTEPWGKSQLKFAESERRLKPFLCYIISEWHPTILALHYIW